MCVLNSVTVAGSFAIDRRPVQPVEQDHCMQTTAPMSQSAMVIFKLLLLKAEASRFGLLEFAKYE